MKCLEKLTAGLSLEDLEFLKSTCRWRGIREECSSCEFYPKDGVDDVCELIKDSQKNIKILIPDRWKIPVNIESLKSSTLPPEIILKKIRSILDNCRKEDDYHYRTKYVSEEGCKDCPLFHIACFSN